MSPVKNFLVRISFLTFFLFLFFVPASVHAEQNDGKTIVAVFVREGCTHCKNEESFLTDLSAELETITPVFYHLEDPDSRALWEGLTTGLSIAKVTPITVIGNSYVVGFSDGQTTGEGIRKRISEAQKTDAVTDVRSTHLAEAGQQNDTCPDDGSKPCTVHVNSSQAIPIPFMGKIDPQKYPLIALSALLGFFDGFNPCAMWVLLTFLIILIEIGNSKKMLVFAGTFILAEAIMYALILTLWYKTWDFVRLDMIVTPVIGVVSVIGGVLFLREWRKKELVCNVTNMQERSRMKLKIQRLTTDTFTFFTFLGILGIAFSVNIIEFACSVGIPQAFTKIMELNTLPFPQWAGLITVYIVFYMLDDIVVFGLAFWGAKYLHLTTKYSKLSNLFGGIVMVILGLLLIFKSHVLLF